MTTTLRVLIVEDSVDDTTLLLKALQRGTWEVTHERVDTAAAMEAALDKSKWDLIIADYSMPRFSGPAALALAIGKSSDAPFILISGVVGEETAVLSMKAGADDYISKEKLARLVPAVERELRKAEGLRKARRTELLLRKREVHLADALQLAGVGTWHLDMSTNLAAWSGEARRILGAITDQEASPFEVLLNRLSPKDRAGFSGLLHHPDTKQFSQVFEIVRADGAAQFVQIRGDIIRDSSSMPLEAAGMIEDISDQKRLEEQLRHKNEELEQQNRRVLQATRHKSEFLANMSHELRTPLNCIIGFSELMHDGRVGQVSPEQKEYLGDILTSARHLHQLINDVLDLAKVESGKLDFHPVPLELSVVIREVCDILRAIAHQKQIEVTTDIDPAIQTVVLDPSKLKQVLYNYLSNALKFTPGGGRVAVRIRAQGNLYFRLEVVDTGIGIGAEDISRLFVEFQQLDASSAKKYQGTGLGLALTKRIVEAQGGRVGVESEPGKSSTFYAILPLSHTISPGGEPVTHCPPPEPGPTHGTSPRAGEGDTRNRLWLADALKSAGHRVEDDILLGLLVSDAKLREILNAIWNECPKDAAESAPAPAAAGPAPVTGPAKDFLGKPVKTQYLDCEPGQQGPAAKEMKTVLVIDDNPTNLKLVRHALQEEGYHAICKNSGTSGLRELAQKRPDAIVLDLLMPGMDGMEFIRQMRSVRANRDVPLVLWTMKSLTNIERAQFRLTTRAIVHKDDRGAGMLLAALKGVMPGPSHSDAA